MFALAGPWLDIRNRGKVVCIDELETSMHPHMVRELLRLFFDPSVNTGGAQVIFTTHNPLLLDTTLLRRDQVWFTDKDAKASNVMLDAKGKKLAEMDGKEVVAKGVEVTKDDAKWFKVASFKEVKAKVEAPAAE